MRGLFHGTTDHGPTAVLTAVGHYHRCSDPVCVHHSTTPLSWPLHMPSLTLNWIFPTGSFARFTLYFATPLHILLDADSLFCFDIWRNVGHFALMPLPVWQRGGGVNWRHRLPWPEAVGHLARGRLTSGGPTSSFVIGGNSEREVGLIRFCLDYIQ